MKKIISVLLAGCLCVAMLCTVALGANQVPQMEIEVALRADGSARITQIWEADTDEGTEFYLACHDSGYLEITDFAVEDENGPYTSVEDWDISASFDEKANRCGVVETEEGVELCWGISDYGRHRYTITYVLHDLVGSYSDADGFHHRFVDEMSFFPTDVALTVCREDGSPLTDEYCDIWAFGFEGEIWFEDGVVRAWTGSPLEEGNHMTVMLSLEKGALVPQRTVNDSFETVKERAFSGSDYDEELTALDIILIVATLVVLLVFCITLILIYQAVQRIKQNRQLQKAEYFRDAPNGGQINATHRLGVYCKLCKEDSLLGAYLLRLINRGCLEPMAEDMDSKEVSLQLVSAPSGEDPYEDILYTVLEAAAGPGGVLEPKELEHYCECNAKPLVTFIDGCRDDGERTLVVDGCFRGPSRNGRGSLTDKGKSQLDEILGLKKFLLDFSLIHERGVKESILWQDYMVYAFLLGIADKVTPQIKELYPDALPQVEQFERHVSYAGRYNQVMYGAYRQEMYRQQAARSSGSGGRVSIGGGGGFSGGGGGGSR